MREGRFDGGALDCKAERDGTAVGGSLFVSRTRTSAATRMRELLEAVEAEEDAGSPKR
jgi:hypothetical protein